MDTRGVYRGGAEPPETDRNASPTNLRGAFAVIDLLLEIACWLCFWREDWCDDDAPEGTRPPRWLRALTIIVVFTGVIALALWLV